MSPELEKIFEQLEAEEPERHSNDWFEVIQHRFPMLKPNQLAQAIAGPSPEQLTPALADLSPEERAAGLSPEQKLELLKTLQKELGQQPN
jgi:hypothetical protein